MSDEIDIPFRIDEPLNQDRSTTLWRYTSLPKFVNLLSESSLFCLRMDLYGDPYEGQLSEPSHERLAEMYKTIADDMGLFESNIALIKELRETTFLNCWRVDEYEDYGMWHAYTSPSCGLAIRTTVDSLIESINPVDSFEGQLELKKIDYIDYEEEQQDSVGEGVFFPLRFKRVQHQNEKEVRLMVTNYPHDRMHLDESFEAPDNIESIRKIAVDTSTLIEEIRLHPEASDALWQAVEHLLTGVSPEIGAERIRESQLVDVDQ